MPLQANALNPAEYEAEFGPGNVERDIYKLAEQRHCEPILPEESELQLDIDTDEDYELMQLQLERLNTFYFASEGYTVEISDEWRSKSGNRHVVISWPVPLTIRDRILWQAILGSDRKRELYNMLRAMKGTRDPITLFKPLEDE